GLIRLPVRKVRYVLDQKLLPGQQGRLQTHRAGRPRSFTRRDAFFLAAAALLLTGGIRRLTVRSVMQHLTELTWPKEPTSQPTRHHRPGNYRPPNGIEAVYAHSSISTALLCIGDGVNLRLTSATRTSAWLEPRSGATLSSDYQPQVVIQLDLHSLYQ